MKKQLILLGIISLLATIGLSGCNTNTSPKNKLIGTWVNTQNEDESYTFYSNGSVYSLILPNNNWADYSITENKLIIEGFE